MCDGTLGYFPGIIEISEVAALTLASHKTPNSIFGEEARQNVTAVPLLFLEGREFDSPRRLEVVVAQRSEHSEEAGNSI